MFFQILTLHGIDLSKEAKMLINASYKKNDKINYMNAMTVIIIDLETAAHNVQNWIVRNPNNSKNKDDTRSKAGS